MELFEYIFEALFYTLGAYLLFNCCYLLFFALAGHRKIKPLKSSKSIDRRFCVLIPAYKENVVVLESSKDALQHRYGGKADVYVIADGLQAETITTLSNMGVGVIEVNFEKSTKGKALNSAINRLPENQYDVAVVLDVDNIMGANFLEEVNRAFDAGYMVVQAHRTAKNTNTSFALLDACNEEINNHIYRKAHYAMGMSSALIGSGMAFDFKYLQKLLVGIGETVGEDKELDFRIARDNVKICYLENVYVLDEKIENANEFTQQRSRWIAAQFELLKKYSFEGVYQLIRFRNIEFFNKVVQAFLVPRMLLIGLLGVLLLQSFINPYGPSSLYWFGLLCALFAALLISLPLNLYRDKRLATAVLRVPYAIFCMCMAVFGVKKATATFIPTPHKAQTINQPTIKA